MLAIALSVFVQISQFFKRFRHLSL